NNDGDTWEITAIADALGGEVLKSPTGSRTDLANSPQDALATYDLTFGVEGTYVAYYRARGFASSSDSIFTPDDFEQDPTQTETLTANGDWNWEVGSTFTVSSSDIGVPLELRIGRRERDAELDAIVLHTIDDLSDSELDALFNLPGDFNHSGARNAEDLEALYAAFGSGDLATYDVNDDNTIDLADAVYWAETFRQTSIADFDLDGDVDVFDAQQLIANFSEDPTAPNRTWSQGDLDGDQDVDFADAMRFRSLASPEVGAIALQAVPEPAALGTLAALSIGMLMRR
ncbi:unnamed protein product, partial [Ectocarpus fasciculatus]